MISAPDHSDDMATVTVRSEVGWRFRIECRFEQWRRCIGSTTSRSFQSQVVANVFQIKAAGKRSHVGPRRGGS